MKTVIIRAPLLSISGYGVHSRQIFRWLLSRQVNVQTQIVPWGNTSWMINPDLEKGLVREIMCRSPDPSKPIQADVSIQVQLPNEWDPNLAPVNIGVSAWVETDICNPEWVSSANRMTALVVPSEFTKTVIEKTGMITVPLYVIPEAFIDEILEDDLPEISLDIDTDFNFLMVGQLTGNNPDNDRKNIFYTLKWLCEEFQNDADVGIVIKTNSARSTTIDKFQTRQTLKNVVGQVRKGLFPKIHFVHGEMRAEEIASLYRHPKIKAFVTMTKGEGWGLPILESAASGLPVIATNWSGHLDFLSKGRFIPVNYTLGDIPKTKIDNRIFIPGSKWAYADEQDAKKKLRKFKERPEVPQKWASDMVEDIRSGFSQLAINGLYDESLGRYL